MGRSLAERFPIAVPSHASTAARSYPTKVPDLIGLKDRKDIDHTGTHRLRGPADVMRYAALVSCCDRGDFGPHRVKTDAQRKIFYRMSDDLLFAFGPVPLRAQPAAQSECRRPRVPPGKAVFEAKAA